MKDSGVTVYRCRWCGRRVWGVFGWFHSPEHCLQRPGRYDWECKYCGTTDCGYRDDYYAHGGSGYG